MLAWAGLRGAVPVVLATFPVIDGVHGSLDFFNIVFFAVLLSTLLQGATFEPVAQALGVTTGAERAARPALPGSRSVRPGAQVLTVRPWARPSPAPCWELRFGGSCSPGWIARARWWCYPTAATRSPGRCSGLGRRAPFRRRPAASSPMRAPRPSGPGGVT